MKLPACPEAAFHHSEEGALEETIITMLSRPKLTTAICFLAMLASVYWCLRVGHLFFQDLRLPSTTALFPPDGNASCYHLKNQSGRNDTNFWETTKARDTILDLVPLLSCSAQSNPHTNHIRIADPLYNISLGVEGSHFNPTIIALPHWAEHQYLLVTRVVTEGLHQESLICEADICDVENCKIWGQHGRVLQCAKPATVLNLPATPAERCEGRWSTFPDIPGFHDPRIFWSAKGEPLIIVNSASQYACLGLWITDLRTVYEPMKNVLAIAPGIHQRSGEPTIRFRQLTELTRNPASSRSSVEKNWFLFSPTSSTSYIHYDLSQERRTFAKLLNGDGHTTPNITDKFELSCLASAGEGSEWHQASNSIKLVLCPRVDAEVGNCSHRSVVQVALIHRKYSNIWDLPMRYERYFIIFDAEPPFLMLAISQCPQLFRNETASGWTGNENWAEETQKELAQEIGTMREARGGWNETPTPWRNASAPPQLSEDAWLQKDRVYGQPKNNWAYFTYTPSIAWAWRPSPMTAQEEDPLELLQVGYLDDDIILGVGLDDGAQAFAVAKAETLLQCMRACPGRREGAEYPRGVTEEAEDEMLRSDTENIDWLDVRE